MRPITRKPVYVATALSLLLLGGCFNRVSGVYKDPRSVISLDFQSDGKVYARVMGVPVASDYQESGNKIIFKGPEGDTFVDIVDANTLSIDHPLAEYTGKIELKKQN